MVLLGANHAVCAEVNEALVVFGQSILHLPPVSNPEGATAGLLKGGYAWLHAPVA